MKVRSLSNNSGAATTAVPEIDTKIGNYGDILFATAGDVNDFDYIGDGHMYNYSTEITTVFGEKKKRIGADGISSSYDTMIKKYLQEKLRKVFVSTYLYTSSVFNDSNPYRFLYFYNEIGDILYFIRLGFSSNKFTIAICDKNLFSLQNSIPYVYASSAIQHVEFGIDLNSNIFVAYINGQELTINLPKQELSASIKSVGIWFGSNVDYISIMDTIISKSRIGPLKVKKLLANETGERKEFAENIPMQTMGDSSRSSSWDYYFAIASVPFSSDGKISRIRLYPYTYPLTCEVHIAKKVLDNGTYKIDRKLHEFALQSSNDDLSIYNVDLQVKKDEYLVLLITAGKLYYGNSPNGIHFDLRQGSDKTLPTGEFFTYSGFSKGWMSPILIDFTPTEKPIINNTAGYLSALAGQKQSYGLENVNNANVVIEGVVVKASISGDTQHKAAALLKTGNTEAISTSTMVPASDLSYQNYFCAFQKNPETEEKFTIEEINNLQVGLLCEKA